MADGVTAPDAQATAATPNGEPAATAAEGNGQENNAKLQEIEARLAEASAQLETAKKDSAEAQRKVEEAEARAAREEAIRKGLQRETTAKLQDYARLRQQLETQSISDSKLDRLEKLVMVSLEQTLDPETRAKVLEGIETERLRKEVEALRAAQRPAAEPARQQDLTADQKVGLREKYFKEFNVDPQDPRIDWAVGKFSTEAEWYDYTKASIERIAAASKPAAQPTQAVDLAAEIARQVEEATNKLREEHEAKLAEARVEAQEARAKAEEAERKAEEAAKRKKAVDREGTPGTAGSRNVSADVQKLTNLPKDWAYDPEKKKEISELLNSKRLRDELVANAQRKKS